MSNIYHYILSVSAAALICAIIKSLTGKNSSYNCVVSLLCGIFIVLTIVSPLFDLQFPDIRLFVYDVKKDAESIIEQSNDETDAELRKIIKEQTEAYVLDKAASIHAEVSVEITLAEDVPMPASIVITGDVAPYNKSTLSRFLETNIGLSEEAQIWK